jgi:hypothetical protein
MPSQRGHGGNGRWGTGAAMTAVTVIFEMTRDYDIIMPIIIAVAVSIGIRRILSPRTGCTFHFPIDLVSAILPLAMEFAFSQQRKNCPWG